MRRSLQWFAFSMVSTCVLLADAKVYAASTELELAAGPSVSASSWRGDFGGGVTLRAGLRFSHVFAVEYQHWESYATVNQRLCTGLSVGVSAYIPLESVHPYARLFAIHQHEESWVSVKNAPAGLLFGVGSGIRHRAGAGLSLGAELPLKRLSPKVTPALISNLTATWFPDDLGPTWVIGLDVGVGLDFLL